MWFCCARLEFLLHFNSVLLIRSLPLFHSCFSINSPSLFPTSTTTHHQLPPISPIYSPPFPPLSTSHETRLNLHLFVLHLIFISLLTSKLHSYIYIYLLSCSTTLTVVCRQLQWSHNASLHLGSHCVIHLWWKSIQNNFNKMFFIISLYSWVI